MFATLINPKPNQVSVSVHSGSVLMTVAEPTGAELHLRFSSPKDAVNFFLGAAKDLHKELTRENTEWAMVEIQNDEI